MTAKDGRGRFYRITPMDGFADRSMAMKASWMDEMRERVYDQIEDLVPDALNQEAPGTGLTIGKLTIHLAWAEALMVQRISKTPPPDDLKAALDPGAKAVIRDAPRPVPPAKGLIELCRRVRDEVTLPAIRDLKNPDEPCWEDGSTPRGILDQLLWHWVYHSGQIGLIRFEWGSDYIWSFDGPIAPEPC